MMNDSKEIDDTYIHRCYEASRNNISIKWLGSEWFMVQQLLTGWTKNLGTVTKCPFCGLKLEDKRGKVK